MIKIFIFLLFGLVYIKYSNANLANILYDKISNSNKVILNGQIDKIMINNLINRIELMTKSNLDKNVFIIIDSIGGDLIEGVNLINWMEESKIKNNLRFECICIKTISTAFVIYQFCDYRYIIDSCLMIQHEPKINIEGTFDFVVNYYQNNFKIHLNMYKLLVEKISNRLNMDIIDYKNKINGFDWIIYNNNEMLQNNLADEKI